MVLFLSRTFLRRLRLVWTPGMNGFLVGDRNYFFFTPDSVVPTETINPEVIDTFLKQSDLSDWELLGFLSREKVLFPGYATVVSSEAMDPQSWQAFVPFFNGTEWETAPLEIRLAG